MYNFIYLHSTFYHPLVWNYSQIILQITEISKYTRMSLESTTHLIIIFWGWPKITNGWRKRYLIYLNSSEVPSRCEWILLELLGPQFSVIVTLQFPRGSSDPSIYKVGTTLAEELERRYPRKTRAIPISVKTRIRF